MTRGGALSDLNNLLNADDMPCYYKPSIKAVIGTIALKQEPRKGHWITKRTIMHDGEFYCDVCDNDAPFNKTFHYCPNCGAKMVEPQEREE